MKIYKGKVVTIFGGAGFIGSNLCDRLMEANPERLVVFDNLCQSSMDNIKHHFNKKNFKFIYGDIRDYSSVEKLVGCSDYVFNLAASNVGMSTERPRVDLQTNVEGTFNILMAAEKNAAVRIVHASSGSVLGDSKDGTPMDEEHRTNPSNMYGISKLAGENYCKFFAKHLGVDVSIVRYFHVFGPRQDYNGKSGVINIFLNRIKDGINPVVWGSGEQIQCFTFVEDVIDATLLIAGDDSTIGEVYNIASKTRKKVKNLAQYLINSFGSKKNKVEYGPAKVGENMRPVPDTKKITELGWEPKYTFAEGVHITNNWLDDVRKEK